MKGNTRVVAALNELLRGELTAMDQYFIHSHMYKEWGLDKLYERINHEFDDEKAHAASLIERILFLEGIPDLSQRAGLSVGKDVPEMLNNDLQLEYSVDTALKAAISLCETEQDYQSREILEQLLKDTEEDHAYWLQQQLGLIQRVGLQNYLQSQIG